MAQVSPGDVARYDAVYVSPHLDDVAISCPGHVMADVAAGRRVLVISVFTEGKGYRVRHEEDVAAMDLLGVDHVRAGLADAPFRGAGPPTFRRIVLERDDGDAVATAAATSFLRQVVPATGARTVVAPLGVGSHVDHGAVHDAVRALGAGRASGPGRAFGPDVRFYEDRPYALVPHLVRLRLAELGVRPRSAPPLPEDAARRAVTADVAYLRSYLVDPSDRETWRLQLDAHAARAGSGALARARSEAHRFPRGVVARIARVLACYGTQVAEVLGSVEEHLARCRSPRRQGGPGAYVERLWELPDPAEGSRIR